jgi:hypothetical protein
VTDVGLWRGDTPTSRATHAPAQRSSRCADLTGFRIPGLPMCHGLDGPAFSDFNPGNGRTALEYLPAANPSDTG